VPYNVPLFRDDLMMEEPESHAAFIAWGGHYTLEYLESLPDLSVAQADSLKIEDGCYRVWLSRCGIEDGEPYANKVTVEYCGPPDYSWIEYATYPALT